MWGPQIEKYASYVHELSTKTGEICGKAIHEMADIVTGKIRQNLEKAYTIPDVMGIVLWKNGNMTRMTDSEKKGLLNSLGIAPMEIEDGYMNVKIGFDGYNDIKTEQYPQGQPNVLIARAVESGSSVRYKQPFVRPAVNAARAEALKACEKVIDREIKKIMK